MGLLSGVLPAVYSASDTLKRKVGGLLSDPVGTIQQQVGLLSDNARSFNQLHSQATQEHVNSIKNGGGMGPAQMKLANTLADSYNPIGMVVWHGSPHKFSKFDSSKIGTGEGAQAYGHGLYLAESDEVAKGYQKTLASDGFLVGDSVFDPSSLQHMNIRHVARKGDVDAAIAKAQEIASSGSPVANLAAQDLARLQQIKAAGGMKPNTGSLYKVDLPDDAIAKMLDWDKPLSQQAPEVRKILQQLAEDGQDYYPTLKEMMQPFEAGNTTGQAVYHALQREGGNAVNATRELRSAGIPGIRYLDGGSRGAGGGTSNFVVFPGNEGLLSILERNGQPVK